MSAAPAAGTTRRAAEWAAGLGYGALPAGVRARLAQLVLDWLGCSLAGSGETAVRLLRQVTLADGSGSGATLLAGGSDAAPGHAAMLNAAAGHALEFDDIYSPGTFHPGTVAIPAALAAAESCGASGETLLAGIAAGYEVGNRVAQAAGAVHYRLWHTTGTAGALAAAAAAGRVLGLDGERLCSALGTAGTLAAGLWEFNRSGAMSKVLHAGGAAAGGLLAARLAASGFSGAPTILEGPQGFFAAMAGGAPSQGEVFADLGRRFTLLATMTKAYPCCGHAHTAVEAACRLSAALGRPAASAISEVLVETNAAAVETAGHRAPAEAVKARFSLSYCTAAALVRGGLTQRDFAPAALADPEVAEVEARARLASRPAFDDAFPGRRTAAVTVVLTDGRRRTETVDVRKGEPANPLTEAELQVKLAGMVGEAVAGGLAAGVAGLAEVRDIRAWARSIAALGAGEAACVS